MKFVKKYIPIVLIIAGIIFVITVFMGCYNKISDEYSRIEDVNIKHDIYSEIARINIKDEYIKDGIKYYIFTTDVSENREFTLSETDYDKYIGNGNNAVDCTIYKLNLNTTLFNYNYLLFAPNVFPYESINDNTPIINILDEMEYVNIYPEVSNICLRNVYETNFKYGEYKFKKPYKEKTINEEINLCRYSFIGESDFTEEEINNYKQIMDKVSLDYLSIIRDSI